MKNKILFIALMAATILIGVSSCKRDFPITASVQKTDGMAYLSIVHASPNFRKLFNARDSFNVFINGQKITGFTPATTPAFMTFGATFPNNSTGFGYIAVPPGQQQIKLSVSGLVNADSIPIITLTKTFLANHQYSLIITDSIQSLRDSSQIFMEDVYKFPPTNGYYNLRFVNTVWNDTANADLYSYAKNAIIYRDFKPGSASAFTEIGVNLQTTDTLYVTRTLPQKVSDTIRFSLRTVLAKITFPAGSQKSYTLYYRGDFTIPTVPANVKARTITYYRQE